MGNHRDEVQRAWRDWLELLGRWKQDLLVAVFGLAAVLAYRYLTEARMNLASALPVVGTVVGALAIYALLAALWCAIAAPARVRDERIAELERTKQDDRLRIRDQERHIEHLQKELMPPPVPTYTEAQMKELIAKAPPPSASTVAASPGPPKGIENLGRPTQTEYHRTLPSVVLLPIVAALVLGLLRILPDVLRWIASLF